MITQQMRTWTGAFGREYTERNVLSLEGMESLYEKNYGITRTRMNEGFLKGMRPSIRILEVGANIGNQLLCLQKMGFSRLFGIELQDYALHLARSRTENITLIQGSGLEIPFKDGSFDLIFTSGLLIHISPIDMPLVMGEIHRCTRKYIMGFEYYAQMWTEVSYRGNEKMLWKNDYAQLYLDAFPDLTLVREEQFRYLSNENVDCMFLLTKG